MPAQFPVYSAHSDEDVHMTDEGSGVLGSAMQKEPHEKPNFMEHLSDNAARGVLLVAEVFKKIHEGGYPKAVTAVASHPNPEQLLHEMNDNTLPALAKDLRDALSALRAAEAVVGTTSSAPAPTLRTLFR